jgi:hypothetical protein
MVAILRNEGMLDDLVTLSYLSKQQGRVAIFNNFPRDYWEDDHSRRIYKKHKGRKIYRKGKLLKDVTRTYKVTPGKYIPTLGKIAQLSESGGKTRNIAIGDYFSQLVLRPLHEVLMKFLKGLETDGT